MLPAPLWMHWLWYSYPAIVWYDRNLVPTNSCLPLHDPNTFHLLLQPHSQPFSTLAVVLRGDLNWLHQTNPMFSAFQLDLVNEKPWQVRGGKEEDEFGIFICKAPSCEVFFSLVFVNRSSLLLSGSRPFTTFVFQIWVTFPFRNAFELRGSENFTSCCW